MCVQLDCLQGSPWKAICLTSWPGKLSSPCLKASVTNFCPFNPYVCASLLSSFLFLPACSCVGTQNYRDCWGTKLGFKSENPATALYFLSLSVQRTQDCHFLLLNNILTFLLALSRCVVCRYNGWDSSENLPLLSPRRSVSLECIFSFLFMSFGLVPWESQQFQKLKLFILTCNHFEKAQNKKHQLQMLRKKKMAKGSPPDMFKVIL